MMIFIGVFGLIGIIFLGIGFFFYHRRKKAEWNCTQITNGIVVELVRKHDKDGTTYHPVFEYYANNERILTKPTFGSNPPQFSVGEEVQVYYDPEDIRHFYVLDDNTSHILETVFLALGGVFVGIAVLMLIFTFVYLIQ